MSKYFDTIANIKGALADALPGVVVEVRSIHSARAFAGVRTLVWVSWEDGPRRSEVAAVVDRFGPALRSMQADLVCVREFSQWARSIIAPGPARELPGDYWSRPIIQDFDLRPILELTAWLDRRSREVRISARARALVAA